MNIGKMNKRGTLQMPVRITDSAKGYVTGYEDVSNVWAELMKPRAAAVANFVENLNIEIAIRHRTDAYKGWRFVCDGKTYGVLATYAEGRDRTIMICEEVVP